jgi:hypothetical protein
MTFEFEFDLLTPDGCLICECIPFRGTLTGHRQPAERDVGIMSPFWEDVDITDVEIEVTMKNRDKPHMGFSGGNTVWQKLPASLEPYFHLWMDMDSTQERLIEQLEDMEAPDPDTIEADQGQFGVGA